MNINEPNQSKAFTLPFSKHADPSTTYHPEELRLPFSKKIPDNIRNHFIAMCGEYVGTVLFLYFALVGTQVANSIPSSAGLTVAQTGSNPQQLQYIALSFGFSLAVNAWVFFRISGGLFNPAVTFGMCLIGALPWFRGFLLFFVQILGGMTAAALVSCMFPGPLNVQTTLGGNTTITQGLFIEMILTAQLIFTIFMLAAEKHKGTFIAPVGIGLSLFVAELAGVYFTGGSLNPARSFGPCVANRNFHGYHWIYWVGPILGAIIASGFYKFIKILEYESANPDQDAAEEKMHAAAAAAAAQHVAYSEQQHAHPHQHQPNGYANFEARHSGSTVVVVGGGGNGVTPPSTGGTTYVEQQRPGMGRATSSQVPRRESPAMGSADEQFAGLAHGMHGEGFGVGPGTQRQSRYRPSRTGNGVV